MDARQDVTVSAAVVLVGTITSGPLAVWLVAATHPQPAWRDAATFVAAYRPVQPVPYFFSFLLVSGFERRAATADSEPWLLFAR
jgi:hypothetical protein